MASWSYLKRVLLCKRCGVTLSEIGIRTKPKIYCPMCKEISKVEAMKVWRIAHNGQ